MGYGQQFALVEDPTFRGRVAMALVNTSQNVINEDPTVADHEQRLSFAKTIFNSPMSYVDTFIYSIAANVAIAADGPVFSKDGDIDYVIATVFGQKALEFAPSA